MSQSQACCSQTLATSPVSPATAASTGSRAAVERLLSDLAFVYHATQRVKQALTSERPTPRRQAPAAVGAV